MIIKTFFFKIKSVVFDFLTWKISFKSISHTFSEAMLRDFKCVWLPAPVHVSVYRRTCI